MRQLRTMALVVSLFLPLCANAQYHSRRGSSTSPTARAGGLQGINVTVHGTVKKISKKEILLEPDENQLITIRCNGKTKFFDVDNTQIKASGIDLESRVTIEAAEDLDSKLLATSVKVESASRKALGK